MVLENSHMLLARKYTGRLWSPFFNCIQVTSNKCHMTPSKIIPRIVLLKNKRIKNELTILGIAVLPVHHLQK